MANYTGADVINAGDVSNYQADIYGFGIASGTSANVSGCMSYEMRASLFRPWINFEW